MRDVLMPLKEAIDAMKIDCDEAALGKFDSYMKNILLWNEKVNLTAIRDEKEFVIKHFVDSIMCAGHIGKNGAKTIVDVGTGAGFPGIPLAILFPEKKFTLVDSTSKKINIIKSVSEEIDLKNVVFIHARAEDLGNDKKYRERFDYCVSRAVASLSVLSEFCLPLVRIGGHFAAFKGSDIEGELAEAERAIRVLGGKVDLIQPFLLDTMDIGHKLIYIKKMEKTPEKYPRKAGKPLKEPI
jgi:16S rRNA (guanine527-N7)-methyltransferase